jgi:dihydrofolate reductase
MSNRKVILSMQVTLDGYVAGKNDEADWLLTGDDEWQDLFKELGSVDTYVLGRGMYNVYADYWMSALNDPSAPADNVKFARIAEKTQHIVFTRGDFKPKWKNTRVAHDAAQEIAKLKKQDGQNIIVWGGANFAADLINQGLIDEYRIALNPTFLTEGKSLFKNVKKRNTLKLLNTLPLSSGLVILRYR